MPTQQERARDLATVMRERNRRIGLAEYDRKDTWSWYEGEIRRIVEGIGRKRAREMTRDALAILKEEGD